VSGADGVPWVVPGFAEERELGRGASGRVVAAVHMASGAKVAVKYLAPRLLAAPGFLEAFRSEAALLRSLDVPQVVRLLDYVEAPGAAGVDRGSSPGGIQGAAIVMELVDGVSLHEMITGQGPASPESALLVLKGSLLGLAAAHTLGIVHRDYKPENVLVDGSGQSKLSDFGVAAPTGQAASGGTPLYMAPEQWDGAPASPATDIYAATVVFFECLTGQTPFSGSLGQLAAQHAAAAAPVELVDEPLRQLITRGMAKSPADRPANAATFTTDLEATAAAVYGQEWESRGRAQLAERAAALLLLLLPHGGAAAAGGTGTSSVSTWLPGAKAAAVKGGIGGWQLAVISAGVAVTVAGAVVGGGTLVTKLANSSHRTASAAAPAPSGKSSPTVPPSAACGSSATPPLAYTTFTGTAQIPTGNSVVVRCGTGAPHTLGSIGATYYGPPTLAWSADGTQLGWLTGSDAYVARASAGTWSVRHWVCQCVGLAFQGRQAVAVSSHAAGGEQTAAIPELLVFPVTGTGPPATLPVTGITTITAFSGIDTEFNVLGSVSATGLVVSYGNAGGTDGGTPILYRVNAAGQATRYPYQPPLPSTLAIGHTGNFTANQADSEFAFSTYSETSYACYLSTAWALDAATGGIIRPKLPAGGGPDGWLGGPDGWLVEGMWVDRTGTPYASLVPSPSDCATNTPLNSAGVTPTVCKLSGGSWVPTGRGVFQAAYGPGNWLAEESGVTDQNGYHTENLSISHGTGTANVTVPNVSAFTWAP
jgi:hypothetical protein